MPPISAVFPSADSATSKPNLSGRRLAPLPVSFAPCCVQLVPERVNTHAAPTKLVVADAADQRGVPVGRQRLG